MGYGELNLGPERITRNKLNGRFLKKHKPHNKGKKWSEWMDGRKRTKVLKGLRRTGNPYLPGANRKKIVAIKDGKLCGVFESSNDAFRKTKINARNIRQVCAGKRPKAGGYQWFYEAEAKKWSQLLTNK